VYAVMNSKRLEELREEKGLSRRELAETAGISMKTLRAVESEKPVRVKTAWKVAGVFGLHPRNISQPYHKPERAAIVADGIDRLRAEGKFPFAS
jgi:DNA-binding XRE family transcriptional regulator